VTDLRTWLVDDVGDMKDRLSNQVLTHVPPDRRRERAAGGNSIVWNLFHAARHAGLALWVLRGRPFEPGLSLDLSDWVATIGGGGLEEAEQPWSEELDPVLVATLLGRTLDETGRYLAEAPLDQLDVVPDVATSLGLAGIDVDRFGWLWKLWQDQPASFFVRWPLLGHVGNHLGEMIATRNQLGLSPF